MFTVQITLSIFIQIQYNTVIKYCTNIVYIQLALAHALSVTLDEFSQWNRGKGLRAIVQQHRESHVLLRLVCMGRHLLLLRAGSSRGCRSLIVYISG